ncbi:MAG: glutamine--fructose-6-phosphate transaminase (isomerizing) [Candidatus Methanospirareceae archaeon]|nr:MAG: glutamine--fructose-6-phosphate transaminase (isomerizing) [Methanophagales archaeon]
MCGIIGYIGPKNATETMLSCLQSLEYRGYDSWGLAVNTENGIAFVKEVGKIGAVSSVSALPKSSVGIGHTRWATHGRVTRANAHPHFSNNKKIAVVHNGIIENFQAQKKFLTQQGFKFYSDTDTEIIPNTIEYHMRRGYDFVEAAKRSLNHLEGQYAIVALHADEDQDQLIAIRKEAPLVIGMGKEENEFFVASDVPAFLDHTKKVIFLEEQDLAIINRKLTIFNLSKNIEVHRKIENIGWDPVQAKKGNFDHFFMKEVAEQAEIIERVVNIDKVLIKEIADEMRKAQGVIFVACGSAAHACLSGVYTLASVAKMHANFYFAHEFKNFKKFLTPESLVIAISQSGETADTLDAIRVAKSCGAKTISITNTFGSSLSRESHRTIIERAGPEICVLSTKTYTAQLAVLTLLAYELAGKMDEGVAKLKELIRYIYYLTSEEVRKFIKKIAENLRYTEHLYLIGRDLQYPTALEAALKIKEVTYIHAEAFAGGELKHGVIALIVHGTPCIVFTSEKNEREIISNAMELKARGAYIIGVGPNNNEAFDVWIKVREDEEANSICQIIPMQLLAYQLAILRGCDPDKPRNLAKSVTVK